MKKIKQKKAIVLFSGGLDSTVTLYYTLDKGYVVYPLLFNYGQRHAKETQYAKRICTKLKLNSCELRILLPWKGSSLMGKYNSVPENTMVQDIGKEIPSTYVPARNTLFLSYALSYAESIGARSIFIGANALDYSGYPDCRPEYIQTFNSLIKKGTRAGVQNKTITIQTPLIHKTKAQIIRLGLKLNVSFENTWSCYNGRKQPCMKCDSCLLRQKGFDTIGIQDPLIEQVTSRRYPVNSRNKMRSKI